MNAIRKIIVFLFFVTASLTTNAMTIRIANGEWGPYLSEYSHEYGLASHIISEAFKSVKVKIEWGFSPGNEATSM